MPPDWEYFFIAVVTQLYSEREVIAIFLCRKNINLIKSMILKKFKIKNGVSI